MSSLAHAAVKKSWWDGRVTTACGLVLAKPKRADWFAPKCPACLAVKS